MEAVHYSLDGHEKTRNLKIKRNLGSGEHFKIALKSHISFNSLRIGSEVTISLVLNVTIKLFLFEYNLCLSLLSSEKSLVPKLGNVI